MRMPNGEKIFGAMDWGMIPYAQASAWQEQLVELRKAGKIPDLLVLCQHPPVITLGRNAGTENVLASDDFLTQRGIELHVSNRGGDVTFHGPGQLVGYPILDLSEWNRDVVAYLRALEEVLIRALTEFGVEAGRLDTPDAELVAGGRRSRRRFHTGVWTTDPTGRRDKIAAIGVHISRWVTSHGFALNISTDLSYFGLIVPCGIADKSVTSLERVLAKPPAPAELMAQAREAVTRSFGGVFNRALQPISSDQWENWLGIKQAAAS